MEQPVTGPAKPGQNTDSLGKTLLAWIDSRAGAPDVQEQQAGPVKVEWLRILPFLLLHIACLAVIWTGVSTVAVATALGLYLVRMFAITGFYHRYFSHRSFKTSRFFQFLMAFIGGTAVQRGALWWAAHHRHHHRYSDEPEDHHARLQHGFLWSHVGWFTCKKNFRTPSKYIPDLERFPELVLLDRFDVVVPLVSAAALYLIGLALESFAPGLGTSGGQMLVWGIISTVVLHHATFTINSLAHDHGSVRYDTNDGSRNNFFLALLTLGEGWHNNHHHYPHAARQGFYWWEIDITWYGLKALQALGIIWDMKDVPDESRNAHIKNAAPNELGAAS